jgi:enoyl-CoA hydratase
VPPLPEEVEAAVGLAVADAAAKVIVLRGAGRAFCASPPPGPSARSSTA